MKYELDEWVKTWKDFDIDHHFFFLEKPISFIFLLLYLVVESAAVSCFEVGIVIEGVEDSTKEIFQGFVAAQ